MQRRRHFPFAPSAPAASLAAALAALVVGAVARPVAACSCTPPPPPAQALAEADAVFEGTVVSVERPAAEGEVAGGGSLVVRLRVTQAWKGVRTETVEVHTPVGSAACGYPFADGERYLVYALAARDHLVVSACGRTRLAADADEDRAALGAGAIPVEVGEGEGHPASGPPAHPARGGCAGCIVNDSHALVDGWGAFAVALVALAWPIRRRGRAR